MKGKFPTFFAKETNCVSVKCFCLNLQVLLVILNVFLHLVFLFVLFPKNKEFCFTSSGAVWVLVT